MSDIFSGIEEKALSKKIIHKKQIPIHNNFYPFNKFYT